MKRNVERVLDLLEDRGQRTTPEIYRELRLYQPRACVLLRRLERDGCVRRAGKKGRALVWEVVP